MKAIVLCDSLAGVDACVAMCVENGLGIEVQEFIDPTVMADADTVAHYRSAIADLEPRGMHGPFTDLPPGSADAGVRQVVRDRFETVYETAVTLGAGHVVLHHGWVPVMHGHRGWVSRSAEFWQDFTADKDASIQFHLESTLEWEPSLILDTVTAIDRPNVDVALDTGHAHALSRVSVLDWIDCLGPTIGYVHVHNNHGQDDEHLALGDGTIPMADVCNALQQRAPDAVWAIETRRKEESLAWLDEHGFWPGRA